MSKPSKLLEENIVLQNIGIGKIFLNRTPIMWDLRAIIHKWDCVRLKSFVHQRKQFSE
jgi:hypothetical protein